MVFKSYFEIEEISLTSCKKYTIFSVHFLSFSFYPQNRAFNKRSSDKSQEFFYFRQKNLQLKMKKHFRLNLKFRIKKFYK